MGQTGHVCNLQVPLAESCFSVGLQQYDCLGTFQFHFTSEPC